MNRIQIIRSQLIEIKIPFGTKQTQFNLQDLPDLRNANIMGLESFNFDDGMTFSPNGVKIINNLLYRALYITMQDYTGKIIMQSYLMTLLHRIQHPKDVSASIPANVIEMFSLTGQRINFPKCFITIADTSLVSDTLDEVLPLIIYYADSPEQEKEARDLSFLERK